MLRKPSNHQRFKFLASLSVPLLVTGEKGQIKIKEPLSEEEWEVVRVTF